MLHEIPGSGKRSAFRLSIAGGASKVEYKIESQEDRNRDNPSPFQVDLMRDYQWQRVNDFKKCPLEQSYQVKHRADFKREDCAYPLKPYLFPEEGEILYQRHHPS